MTSTKPAGLRSSAWWLMAMAGSAPLTFWPVWPRVGLTGKSRVCDPPVRPFDSSSFVYMDVIIIVLIVIVIVLTLTSGKRGQ